MSDQPLNNNVFPVSFQNRKVYFAVDNPNDQLQAQHILGNFYKIEQLLTHKNLIFHGSTVLDLGANVGNHTIFYGLFTTASLIYAFEPNPPAFNLLEKSVDINSLRKKIDLSYLGFAVGAAAGTAYVAGSPENNLGGTYLSPVRYFDDAAEFRCVSLDELSFSGRISFMKIDVEGWELAVLDGAASLIKEHRPSIAVEINQRNDVQFWNWLESNNYHVINLFYESVGVRNYIIIPRSGIR
jgi:FkbM family methyltransferase